MRVRLGRLDPLLNVWVDAQGIQAPGSAQITMSGPGWERVWVVRTPEADQITLERQSGLPAFAGLGLAHAAERVEQAIVQLPEPIEHYDPEPTGRTDFLGVLSWFAWVVAGFATVAVLALATGLLDAQVIQSPSMQPTLKPGDLYVGVSTRVKAPQVGDVAAFMTRQLNGTEVAVFVHRIIGVDDTGYLTKGDANAQPEALATKPDDVRSTEWFSMPFGGLFISLRPVMIALLGALVMLLLIRLRDDWRR